LNRRNVDKLFDGILQAQVVIYPIVFDPKVVRFLDPAQRFQVAFCGETADKEWD